MNKFERIVEILLLMIVPFYWLVGPMFNYGSFSHQIIIGLWYIVSFFYIFRFLIYENERTGLFLFILLLLNTVYWIFSPRIITIWGHHVGSDSALKFIFQAISMYFPFYCISRKGGLGDLKIVILFVFLFITLFFQYQYNAKTIMDSQGSDATTNNIAYGFCMLLPLLYVFMGKQIVSLALYTITLLLVVFGAKRGALICFSVVSVLFLYFLIKNSPKKMKFGRVLFVVFAFAMIVYYGYQFGISNDFFMHRVDQTIDGNSSNRDWMYPMIWNYSIKSNVVNILFGHGFMESTRIAGVQAHQDWLELFSNMGVLGVIVYLFFFISMYSCFYKNRFFLTNNEKFCYLGVMAIWTIKPFFSMTYYSVMTCLLSMSLGLLQGRILYRKNCGF